VYVASHFHRRSVPSNWAELRDFSTFRYCRRVIVTSRSHQFLTRPIVALLVIVIALGTTMIASKIEANGLQEDPAPAEVEAEPEDIPGLGSIIGSPDPGPKPEDAGDRGGWAQLALGGIVIGGVAFIVRKIFREAEAGRKRGM
jgi:hypothetical protein